MIQFTVVHSNGSKQIQRKHCDEKLFEVQKKLTTFLFGNRKDPVLVKRFEAADNINIIRLPQNFKIILKELKYCYNTYVFCNELQKIITETPRLDLVETARVPTERFHHQLIETAKCLRLEVFRPRSMDREESFLYFLSLSNREVHVKYDCFTLDEYARMIKHWIENDREVGTCYTFGYFEHQKFDKMYRIIIDELNGDFSHTIESHKNNEFLTCSCVTIPISCTTQIEISRIYYSVANYHLFGRMQSMMKMEITSQ
ncbi:hypothetical protein CAEBREN_02687 [Caenorhabditis brenneri]|uniref:F-box associated domain-containing protein n=1 Tax=Caenorhabditis brenneri TaxID=135651 RepID=G0PNI2_CAEBE|nr:hypothetical protein CAEBREN_02687 [Caenorhabditis brenneri]